MIGARGVHGMSGSTLLREHVPGSQPEVHCLTRTRPHSNQNNNSLVKRSGSFVSIVFGLPTSSLFCSSSASFSCVLLTLSLSRPISRRIVASVSLFNFISRLHYIVLSIYLYILYSISFLSGLSSFCLSVFSLLLFLSSHLHSSKD